MNNPLLPCYKHANVAGAVVCETCLNKILIENLALKSLVKDAYDMGVAGFSEESNEWRERARALLKKS